MVQDQDRKTLEPVGGANRSLRQHLGLRGEFTLALLPTLSVLVVFTFVEVLSQQRLLFASLASSAFLIHLDPQHGTNSVRTLIVAQLFAVLLGFGANHLLGPTYLAGGSAMALTIGLLILVDAVHPPAVSTALSFALRPGDESQRAAVRAGAGRHGAARGARAGRLVAAGTASSPWLNGMAEPHGTKTKLDPASVYVQIAPRRVG